MTTSILFSTYLNDVMNRRRVSADHLAHELGYKHCFHVQHWLNGLGRPSISELSKIAVILKADPVEVAVGWLIDQCPEMETALRDAVLEPRASTFPRSDDLTLRMPKPVEDEL